jgi:ubiquinone/menaquinone biosynthesis C-methylase UbiE
MHAEEETRAAYDTVAADYALLLHDALDASPEDRAVLALFAERVRATGGVRVLDAGCGPGRLTGHLRDLGLDAAGVDLSPGMVAEARRRHPDLAFSVGDLTALDLADGSVDGVVAWYSLIHTPPERWPDALAELHRVLVPGGQLVVAFQVGDERRHREEAYGHPVPLTSYRLPAEHVAGLLDRAGLPVDVRVLREPSAAHETTPQAYLLARRSSTTASEPSR